MSSDLEAMYQDVILEESSDPYRKVYAIDDPNKSRQFNPSCGDEITMSVALSDDLSKVKQITWSGEGCSISIASASIMVALLEAKSIDEARQLVQLFKKLMNSRGEGLEDTELDQLADASVFTGTSKFPARIKCALLGWVAFEVALNNALKAKISQGVATDYSSHKE